MTSERSMEELKQRAKELAERIDQLEEQINNVQPITGLLGRWATNRYGEQVLITIDRPVGGWIETAYVKPDGATREKAEWLDDITFLDQTTRPHDTLETVTTEEEYEALPEGSVVAESGRMPWVYLPNVWVCRNNPATTAEMAGTTRHVLRWGR